jgi:hypothetical protein
MQGLAIKGCVQAAAGGRGTPRNLTLARERAELMMVNKERISVGLVELPESVSQTQCGLILNTQQKPKNLVKTIEANIIE